MEEILGTAMASGTCIAIVWLLVGAYRSRLAFAQRKLEIMAGQAPGNAPRDSDLVLRQAAMEQRMRVLERIITEHGGSGDIALQIEALRDMRETEAARLLVETKQ
jgi:hypothetical protein